MRHGGGLAPLLVWAAACGALAQEHGPHLEGSLAWIASDRLDLVGTVAAEAPLATIGAWRVATSLLAVTAIEKADSSFTFDLDRVSYTAGVSVRRELAGRGAVELFAGEQGVQRVDAPGHARVREIAGAWESPGYRRAFGPPGWSGRASAGLVLEHSNLDAVATVSGAVRYLHASSRHPGIGIGADATVDTLIGHDGGTDLTIGPRVEFDLTGDRRFGLFARWLRARNPLGLATDGVLAGFDFAEGLHATGERVTPPEISGSCAAGAGGHRRGIARLDLRVVSPPFLGGTHAEIEVDGNVLTSEDRNDLFYLYDVGIARPFSTWRAGVWFHHRSNHVVGAANPTVTSINVLEAGIESHGWNRAEPSGVLGRAGALDARLRAGWLIDSAFGGVDRWHARGGARWASPALGTTRLYASAEIERGDVSGSAFAAGALLPRGWDVRVEARHDEQLFSVDRRARLAIATLRY